MPRLIIPSARNFAIAGRVFAALVFLICTPETESQTNSPAAETPSQSQAPVQLKVSSNLVVVRVVVRDPDRKPIAGLHKEDFRLFDQGKEQTIAQFDVETSATPPSGSAAAHAAEQGAPEKNELAAADGEAQAQQIRQAILSKAEIQEIPVTLEVKLARGQGENHDLSLFAHLDATTLHFHKDGDHNLNTVTFVFAVFDQKENLLNAQQRRARINILDGQLAGFLKAGVDVNATFQLKPGAYRVREVVTDAEDHHLSTLSREITVQ